MKLFIVLATLTASEGHFLQHKLQQPDATDEQLKDAHQRTLAAEKKLQANIWETQHLTKKLVQLEDTSAHEQDIERHEKIVANETESKALATFLGSMWREMHQFSGPFYVEHVEEELKSLAVDRGQMEADLKDAKDDESQLNHLQQSISKADVDSDSEKDEEEQEEASSDDKKTEASKESEAGSDEKKMDTESKTVRLSADETENGEVSSDDKEAAAGSHASERDHITTVLGSAEALSAGIDESAKQLGHLANHGLSAGAASRQGVYPVDLSGGTPLGHVAAHASKSVADAEAAQEVTGKIQLQGDASDEQVAATRAAVGVKHMSHAAVDAGLKSTIDQFEHFRTHGIGAGAALREGLYPVDFSAHQDADSAPGGDFHAQTAKDDDDENDSDDEDEEGSVEEAAAGIGSALHEDTAQGVTKGLGKTLQQFQNLREGITGGPVRTGVYPVKLATN